MFGLAEFDLVKSRLVWFGCVLFGYSGGVHSLSIHGAIVREKRWTNRGSQVCLESFLYFFMLSGASQITDCKRWSIFSLVCLFVCLFVC